MHVALAELIRVSMPPSAGNQLLAQFESKLKRGQQAVDRASCMSHSPQERCVLAWKTNAADACSAHLQGSLAPKPEGYEMAKRAADFSFTLDSKVECSWLTYALADEHEHFSILF